MGVPVLQASFMAKHPVLSLGDIPSVLPDKPEIRVRTVEARPDALRDLVGVDRHIEIPRFPHEVSTPLGDLGGPGRAPWSLDQVIGKGSGHIERVVCGRACIDSRELRIATVHDDDLNV